MSIKAGAILFDANGFIIDRIQTGGPGSLNIPEEKIYEVGNWNSVGTVYDIPDLSFDLESYDVSPEFENILINVDPTTASAGDSINFQDAYAIDVISPFKSARNQFDIINGIVVPYLTLERASYSFGVGQSATQSFTLRGDSIFYCPGQPIMERAAITNDTQSFTFNHGAGAAALYDGGGSDEYVLSATLYGGGGAYKQVRLFPGSGISSQDANGFSIDYTGATQYNYIQYTYSLEKNDNTGLDYTSDVHAGTDAFTPGSEGGPLAADQGSPDPGGWASPSVDSTSPYDAGAKPAAVRAKDIDVYTAPLGSDPALAASWTRLTGVQSFEVNWSVTLENDEELGNSRYVDQDYDVPDVNGSMTIKAFDVAGLFSKLNLVTGVADTKVVGPNVTDSIQIRIEIRDPNNSGTVLKSIYLPTVRFSVPGLSAQVQTKLESQFDFSDDTGAMTVYKGTFITG